MAKLFLSSIDAVFRPDIFGRVGGVNKYIYTLTYEAVEPLSSGEFPHEIEVNLGEPLEKAFKVLTPTPPTPAPKEEETRVVVHNSISQLEISD